MVKNKFDLKGFRENYLKMSQKEFADRILEGRKAQTDIVKMEKNPEKMSLDLLLLIASKTGMSLDQLLDYNKMIPEPLSVEAVWGERKKKNEEYFSRFLRIYNDTNSENTAIAKISSMIESIDREQKVLFMKPKVVFSGQSDSGKSTMINALMGNDKLPTSWTPTTSITIYIKHVDDRPSYIEDELWMFKKDETSSWDDSRVTDEEYCRGLKVAGGNAEMLRDYGTNLGGHRDDNNIDSAVLFVDSDILKNCDLVDLPGFVGGIESDNEMAYRMMIKADILVYLSQCNNFLNSEDAVNIKKAIDVLKTKKISENLPELSTLFIVATQAQIIDSELEINKVLDSGAERLFSVFDLGEDINSLEESTIFTYDEIRARFFSYTIDDKGKRIRFEENFRRILEELPRLFEDRYIECIQEYIKNKIDELERKKRFNEAIKKERQALQEELKKINDNEPKRSEGLEKKKVEILEWIDQQRIESKREFANEYNNKINVDNIKKIIEKKDFLMEKKEGENKLARIARRNKAEMVATYLNSLLNNDVEIMLEDRTKDLTKKVDNYIAVVDDYIKKLEASFKKSAALDTTEMNFIVFNVTRAFGAGLVGGAVYGGLAAWAAGLGNLGGYILVAKGVSLLSTLGIHVGGAAVATSTVAAIGGPVVVMAGLGIIAALGAYGVISVGEKDRIAKKIVKTCKEKEICEQFCKVIDKYWGDTIDAFNNATKNVEDEWRKYKQDLERQISESDGEIDKEISINNQMIDILNNIPCMV